MVWYFAYGANMQRATVSGRRGAEIEQAVTARLDGWRLVFDKPPVVPLGEGMGNIVRDDDARVLGVAFSISDSDYEHIELTEGVLLGAYRRIEVSVTRLDDGTSLDARTLSSEKSDASLVPSSRYLGMLIEGATEHGLPADYVDELRSVPTRPETPEAAEIRRALRSSS